MLRRAGNWHIAQLMVYQTDEVRNEARLVLSPLTETLQDYLFRSPAVSHTRTSKLPILLYTATTSSLPASSSPAPSSNLVIAAGIRI